MNTETVPKQRPPVLYWAAEGTYREAILDDFYAGDGVRFSLEYRATCHRRGQWCLLVEVAHEQHLKWGCFDSDDQPRRYYHGESAALSEAQAIADVLFAERRR